MTSVRAISMPGPAEPLGPWRVTMLSSSRGSRITPAERVSEDT
jgi:hypothetical protein